MSQEPKKKELTREEELRDRYRLLFLGNSDGRIVLADMFHKLKFFKMDMQPEDLPLRNYAMELIAELSEFKGDEQALAFVNELMGSLDVVRDKVDRQRGYKK